MICFFGRDGLVFVDGSTKQHASGQHLLGAYSEGPVVFGASHFLL